MDLDEELLKLIDKLDNMEPLTSWSLCTNHVIPKHFDQFIV